MAVYCLSHAAYWTVRKAGSLSSWTCHWVDEAHYFQKHWQVPHTASIVLVDTLSTAVHGK